MTARVLLLALVVAANGIVHARPATPIERDFEPWLDCAEHDDSYCAFRVAKAYYTGEGVERDKAKAAHWYRRAAELGDMDSASDLGAMLVEGDGIPRDEAEGARWILLAADGGSAWAFNRIGYIYAKGIGVELDYGLAVKWYRKAAEGGNATAMFNLAWRYFDGTGVKQSYRQAREWCERAIAAKPDDGALWLLGRIHVEGLGVKANPELGRRYLTQSAELGYSRAQHQLAEYLRTGGFLRRDMIEARRWYQTLIDAGDNSGLYGMAITYRDAEDGESDNVSALAWMKRAAAAGDADAQNDLGVMFERGQGTPRDDERAVHWYRVAAANGAYNAPNNLGVMLEDGRGAPQDQVEALEWFRKGAALGYGAAANNIGWMYLDGRVVPRDKREADRWFRESRRLGFEPTRRILSWTRDDTHHARLRSAGERPFAISLELVPGATGAETYRFSPRGGDGRLRGELRLPELAADTNAPGAIDFTLQNAEERLALRLERVNAREPARLVVVHKLAGGAEQVEILRAWVLTGATVPFEFTWEEGAPLRLRVFEDDDRFYALRDGRVGQVTVAVAGVRGSLPFLTYD